MTISKISPSPTPLLEWDSELEEPFIVLQKHPDLRITPVRKGDESDLIEMFNDPILGKVAYRRPYPYTLQDAQWLINEYSDKSRRPVTLSESQFRGRNSNQECPVRLLRGPTGKVIGDIHIFSIETIAKSSANPEVEQEPEKVCEVAYALHPEYHGQGIGSDLLRTLIDAWVVPTIKKGKVVANAESDNLGSLRVLRKNGFIEVGRSLWDWPVDKGGGARWIVHFERDVLS